MPDINQRILPLYPLFERLRQYGFPLGVRDYQNFIHALQNGFGYSAELGCFSRQSVLHLCKLLWLKPNQSIEVFENFFDEAYRLEFFEEKTNSPQSTGNTHKEPQGDFPKDEKANHLPPKTNLQNKKDLNQEIGDVNNNPISVRIGVGLPNEGEVGGALDDKKEIEIARFLFVPHFYPLERRKTNQNLRTLSVLRAANSSKIVNIEKTINNTINKGVFSEIIFSRKTENVQAIVLLIDQQGSMTAFHALSEMLKSEMEKVFQTDTAKTFNVFYFYNLPNKYYYTNTIQTKYIHKDKLKKILKKRKVSIVILSDAGAAKGTYSPKRITSTRNLLSELYSITHKIAWLNPMPEYRWEGSSAESISENVAMFEANTLGIQHAIRFLRGNTHKFIKTI